MASGIGITIGSDHLRTVEVRRKGAVWQVVQARAVGLDGGDDAARVASARGALGSLGLRGQALLGLSGKDLIVRYTRAPRVPDWRLEMLMRFEIEEVAAQSGGDVAADWALLSLPAAAGEDDTVLVALARNRHLKPRLAALDGNGMPPVGGCPRSIALYHAFVTNCPIPPGEVTTMVHLGAENTDVAIQRDGALIFARNLSGGGAPFTAALAEAFGVDAATAERMKVQKGNITPRQNARYADSSEEKVANVLLSTAGTVVSAVHSSVMFCKAQTKLQDLAVDRVLVSGGGARLRGLCEYLASSLGIPVEPFDPFTGVDLSALPADAAEAIQADAPSMAAALGLAQMAADPKAFRLEILPEAERRKRHFVQRTAWLIGAGAVALGGLIFLYVTKGAEEARASENAAAVTKALDHAAKMRAEGDQMLEKVERARDRMDLLGSRIRLGQDFVRAKDSLQAVIDGSTDFQAVHFTQMQARFQQLEIPADLLREEHRVDPDALDEGEDGGFGAAEEEPLQARVPVVVFEGIIQQRDKSPGTVHSAFSAALQDAVQAGIPGTMLDIDALQRGGRFKVTMAFFDGYRAVGGR